jgi:hypothetical protein
MCLPLLARIIVNQRKRRLPILIIGRNVCETLSIGIRLENLACRSCLADSHNEFSDICRPRFEVAPAAEG